MAWKVLHLKPRSEKRMAEICRQHKLDYYLPLKESVRIYPKRRVTFEIPLFPGYIFVDFRDDTTPYTLRCNYIVRILTPHSEFKLLRQLVQIRRLLRLDPNLQVVDSVQPGDSVRIKSGPLSGIIGVVTRVKNKPRFKTVTINIDLIGQAIAAEVQAHLVERY